GQLAVRRFEAVEEAFGRIQSDRRQSSSASPMTPSLVHGYLAKPGAKGPLAPPLELRKLADYHEEHLLCQVVDLFAEAWHACQPSLDQRLVNRLKTSPVGAVRSGRLEPIQQANRSRIHWPCPDGNL